MDMKTLIMFGFFALVVVAAIIMVYRNRQKVQASRNRMREANFREPSLNANYQTTQTTRRDILPVDNFQDPEYENANRALDTQIDPVSEIEEDEFSDSNTDQADKKIDMDETYVKPANNPLFPNDLIALMLRSHPDRLYAGYELLQALLSAGLRFGKMNIFHRYEQLNSSGRLLFSLASAAEPGTFEIPKMGGFSCPGLMLFMRVSTQRDLSATFELLIDTAKQLVDDLGGEIWDDQRQPLSDEKIAAWRSKINIYEQSRQTEDMFAA